MHLAVNVSICKMVYCYFAQVFYKSRKVCGLLLLALKFLRFRLGMEVVSSLCGAGYLRWVESRIGEFYETCQVVQINT